MSSNLAVGSKGPDVVKLQDTLNFLGLAAPPLAADGIFGPKTQAAVIAFQQRSQLSPDGIVGPLTANALVAATMARIAGGKPQPAK